MAIAPGGILNLWFLPLSPASVLCAHHMLRGKRPILM